MGVAPAIGLSPIRRPHAQTSGRQHSGTSTQGKYRDNRMINFYNFITVFPDKN